jgi:RecA-family ATPase
VGFDALQVDVITAPVLRLDTEADRNRLAATVEALRPLLLILDPMIRLHRVDENDASQIALLLSFLRELQRRFHLAVILVHHARKDSNGSRPGQALRGSSELHGWGDVNLYVRRRGPKLTLTTEHRAAPSQDDIPLELVESGAGLALAAASGVAAVATAEPTPMERVLQALEQIGEPTSAQRLREICGMRTASVGESLAALIEQGLVVRDGRGYRLSRTEAA